MLEKAALEQSLQVPFAILSALFLAVGYKAPGLHQETIKNEQREVIAQYELYIPQQEDKDAKSKVITFFSKDKIKKEVFSYLDNQKLAITASQDEDKSIEILKDISRITSLDTKKLAVVVNQSDAKKVLEIICQNQNLIDEVYFLKPQEPTLNCLPKKGLKIVFITNKEVSSKWDSIDGINLTLIQSEILNPLSSLKELESLNNLLKKY